MRVVSLWFLRWPCYCNGMKIIAVANRKGGVGKTAVSVNVAAGFAAGGRRTLLVDLDSQGNSTLWLLGELAAAGAAEALVAGAATPALLVPDPRRPRLDLLPASRGLAGAELALSGAVGGEVALREVLAGLRGRYDVVLLDCPPSLGLVTVTALVAATALVAPTTAGSMPLAGLSQLDAALSLARARLRSRCEHLGFVLFAADEREAVTRETRDELGDRLLGEVRVSTAAKTLPAHRLTAFDPGADARGAEDYRALVGLVARKLGVRLAR